MLQSVKNHGLFVIYHSYKNQITPDQSSKSPTEPNRYMKTNVSKRLGSRAGKGSEKLPLGPWI